MGRLLITLTTMCVPMLLGRTSDSRVGTLLQNFYSTQ
jgi:hypothetical protein